MILLKINKTKYKINMDTTLVENFQKQLNNQFNELIVSMLEQYKCEIEELNTVLLSVTQMIKEKECLTTG